MALTVFAEFDQRAGHSIFDFEEALRLVPKQTVLCVGDVMLDDFVYGEVTRISPEAPTPVLAVKHNRHRDRRRRQCRSRNIAALGATCIFVGLVGEDEAGVTLRTALGNASKKVIWATYSSTDFFSSLGLLANRQPLSAYLNLVAG